MELLGMFFVINLCSHKPVIVTYCGTFLLPPYICGYWCRAVADAANITEYRTICSNAHIQSDDVSNNCMHCRCKARSQS